MHPLQQWIDSMTRMQHWVRLLICSSKNTIWGEGNIATLNSGASFFLCGYSGSSSCRSSHVVEVGAVKI